MGSRETVSSGAAIGLVGVLAAAVPAFDVYYDVVAGKPLVTTLVENAPLLLLAASIVAAGAWLARSDWDGAYARTMARLTVGSVAGAAVLIALVVFVQLELQGELKPFVIAADAVVIGAVGGVLVGFQSARQEQALDAADAERDRARALFANSTEAIALVEFREDGPAVTDVNVAFAEVFGYDPDDFRVASLRGLLIPADARDGEIPEARLDEPVSEREVTRLTAGGEREFLLQTVPVGTTEAGDPEAYLVYTDITEQKRREQQLESAREELETAVRQLERSNEELEQFAYIASHDLQEPLRMVSSYVDLIESEYGDELDAEAREYIDYAVGGANRMQDMIDDLLTFSRVGERNLDRERVDADEVLDEVLADLQVSIEERSATIERGELPTVYADPGQLGRVFQNLITNAIDYAGEDPPSITIEATEREDAYAFRVEDDGIGIPEDQHDRIFDIFTRGERDDEDGGTGIGLTLCRRIVQAHDGEITVDSEPGAGTTFTFTLRKEGGES
ncbi:MAG: ATP-binding protein [Halobacteriales archaeon]